MEIKLSKAASVILAHMRENHNFLTISEASTAFNQIKELKNHGYIVDGACSGGVFDGVTGFVVVEHRVKPEKKEFSIAPVRVALIETKERKKSWQNSQPTLQKLATKLRASRSSKRLTSKAT